MDPLPSQTECRSDAFHGIQGVVDGTGAQSEAGNGLGERVLFCKLIRDGILRHFDPRKLSDLRYVLELRCFKGLLDDQDLKEVYFEQIWGFGGGDFPLASWADKTVDVLQRKLKAMHSHADGTVAYPPGRPDVYTISTKLELVREYWALTLVPEQVYKAGLHGANVLRELREGGIDGIVGKNNAWMYVIWACEAGLDASLICTLAGRCEKRDLEWAMGIVGRLRNPMFVILSSIYHARPGQGLLLGFPRLALHGR